jgi:hypothetical protein
VAFLKELRSFDQPLLTRADEEQKKAGVNFVPNPKLPQFPGGTEAVLVRRALLIDSAHWLTPSPLTESVQLRVVTREGPAITAAVLNAVYGGRAGPEQAFEEFRLSRALLFAGRAGGLRAVGRDERDFKTGFGAHGWDEFEEHFVGQTFAERRSAQPPILQCAACHGYPGVYSFNSFFDFRGSNTREGDSRRGSALVQVSLTEAAGAFVKWKQDRPDWKALSSLLAK